MEIRDPQVLQEMAQMLKTMGETTRLRLLQELLPGEKSVGELVSLVGSSQANVSKHLSRLRGAGLVASRREGSQVFFRIGADFVHEVCNILCRGLEQRLDLDRDLRRKVRQLLHRGSDADKETP
jgi:DNA-binding transcriptional ArsR family regulator